MCAGCCKIHRAKIIFLSYELYAQVKLKGILLKLKAKTFNMHLQILLYFLAFLAMVFIQTNYYTSSD